MIERLTILLVITLGGCASYHNTKGNAQIAMDQPEDGVQSQENWDQALHLTLSPSSPT